jgi:hypothetical protein
MVRALPSAVPPKMYRHFALVTVLLTLGVAMFADGENREVAAAQVEQPETTRRDDSEVVKPPIADRPEHRQRSRRTSEFDGFDPSFGAPMDAQRASLASGAAAVASAVSQTGYSDEYLASLDAQKRALLIAELEKEGLASADERERKTAALVASSEARSGRSTANH